PRSRACHREAELRDQLLRAPHVLLAADPQRDHPLAIVLGGRERHVLDAHALAPERERDLRDHTRTVRHRRAQLVDGASEEARTEQRFVVAPSTLVPIRYRLRIGARQRRTYVRQAVAERVYRLRESV